MDIITGYVGESHITSEQDRDINIGIVGPESYVMSTGAKLEAQVSTNNEIKIRDGMIMHQGCAASIKKNTYDSLTINNGSQGMERIDLIVARYEREPDTAVESIKLVVLQGKPAETNPEVPEYIVGDIQSGDNIADMPLYEVKLSGLNIVEVNKVFKLLLDEDEAQKQIAELNSNLFEIIKASTGYAKKYANGLLEQWGLAHISAQTGYATVDFPVPFIDTAYSPTSTAVYVSSVTAFKCSCQNILNSRMYIYAMNGTNKVYGAQANWHAIGFWK